MTSDVALSVLIPAWDEEEAIGSVVHSVLDACRGTGVAAECLVAIDPRTTDRTAELANDAGARSISQKSRGLTAAVIELAGVARGSVCVVMDGDGQHDGAAVYRLAERVLTHEVDLVTGARHPDSIRSGFSNGFVGKVRCLGARLLASVARSALRQDIPDPLSGMFACKRNHLLRLARGGPTVPPTGYKILLGLLASVSTSRVGHLTVPFLARTGGRSKLNCQIVLTTLRQLCALWYTGRSSVTRQKYRRVSGLTSCLSTGNELDFHS